MHARTTWTLLGIAALLTAYVLVFERSSPPWVRQGRVFRDLTPADVVWLQIERKAGKQGDEASGIIELERRGEYEWWIVRPLRFRALLPRVEGLVWELVDLVRIDAPPPGSEAHAKAIPAEGPEFTVRFRTRSGTEHVVEVGRDHPAIEGYLYARVDGSVIVTRATLRSTFAVGPDDLRSRALVPVAPADTVRYAVERPRDAWRMALARADTGTAWRFEKPEELHGKLAERKTVESILAELNGWKIVRFEADQVNDWKPYGLDPPRFRIAVRRHDGNEVRVEVGRSFKEGDTLLVYARHAGEPFLYAAEGEIVKLLETEAEELRAAYVFDFEGREILQVHCRGRGRDFVLKRERRAEEKDGGEDESPAWIVEDRIGKTNLPGDAVMISRALAELRKLLIEKYLDDAGPPPSPAEALLIEVTLEDDSHHELRIEGRSQDPRDSGLDVYVASRPADGSRFLLVTPWVKRIEKGPYAFRDRKLSRIRPRAVLEIAIAAGGTQWRIGRTPGSYWSFPAGVPILEGKSLDGKRIDELLSLLAEERFSALEFLPELGPETFARLGIDSGNPQRAIRFLLFEEEPRGGFRRWLIIGKAVPGADPPQHYARADGVEAPFTIEKTVADRFDRLVDHLREVTGKE